MHSVVFHSNAPFDHVPRTLDLLRRMGFSLSSIHADSAERGGFLVRIAFDSGSLGTARNLLDRLGHLQGLSIGSGVGDRDALLPCAVGGLTP